MSGASGLEVFVALLASYIDLDGRCPCMLVTMKVAKSIVLDLLTMYCICYISSLKISCMPRAFETSSLLCFFVCMQILVDCTSLQC